MIDVVDYLTGNPIVGISFAFLVLVLVVLISDSKYNRWPSLPERTEARWTKLVLLQLVHASTCAVTAAFAVLAAVMFYFTNSMWWSGGIVAIGIFMSVRCIRDGVRIPGLLDLMYALQERTEAKRRHAYHWRSVREEPR